MRRAVAFSRSIKDSKAFVEQFAQIVAGLQARRTPTTTDLLELRSRPRRRHLQRPAPQRTCSTGSRPTSPSQHLPHPLQRPLPVRRRRRPRAGRRDVPQPPQLRHRRRPVRRPRHAPGRGQAVRLHHPAHRHPRRHDARGGPQGQREIQGRLAGPPGPPRPRRPLQRHDQPARAEHEAARTTSRSSASAVATPRRRTSSGTATASPRSAKSRAPSPSRSSRSGRTRSTPRSSRRSATARYWEDLGQGRRRHRRTAHHPHQGPARRRRRRSTPRRSTSSSTACSSNLNDAVTDDDAIEMLAQHLITRPSSTPCSRTTPSPSTTRSPSRCRRCSTSSTSRRSRRRPRRSRSSTPRSAMRAEGIDNAEGRQQIIIELYDKFFKTAFPRWPSALGIVYTPVEVVDFIIHSVEDVLRDEFDSGLGDEGRPHPRPVHRHRHFIVRLLQCGLIQPDDLLRKYTARAARQRDRPARLLHRRHQHRGNLPRPPARSRRKGRLQRPQRRRDLHPL